MEPKNTMEVTTEVKQETAKPNWMLRCGDFILRNTGNIFAVMMAAMMIGRVALAAPDGGAESMWTTLTDLITTWVFRLGGVVVFVGGIMFALGWKLTRHRPFLDMADRAIGKFMSVYQNQSLSHKTIFA